MAENELNVMKQFKQVVYDISFSLQVRWISNENFKQINVTKVHNIVLSVNVAA